MPLLDPELPAQIARAAVLGLLALGALGWIAFRIRWWRRAQLRRAWLGAVEGGLDGLAEGQVLTLRGKIALRGEPCYRFEDGAPAAATIVTTAGREPQVHVAQRAAGQLHLELSDGAVALRGAIEVVVGSHECQPLASWAELARAVRSRVEQLEAASKIAPIKSRLVFRSLAVGDLVRARGVLRRLEPEEVTDYRGPALVWAITAADDALGIEAASEGLPRMHGALSALIRGVRSLRSSTRIAGWFVLVGLAFAVLVTAVWPSVRAMAQATQPSSSDAARRLTQQGCKRLASQYERHRAEARSCQSDSDCIGQIRGGSWFELDGCWRFVNPRLPSLIRADRAANAWRAGGCAAEQEGCAQPPPVFCRNGVCTERPPEPIPPSWNRHDVLHFVSFFLPPSDRPVELSWGRDSLTWGRANDRLDVYLCYGRCPCAFPESALDQPPVEIDGRKALIARNRATDVSPREGPFVAVYFPRVPLCEEPRCRWMHFRPPGETQLCLRIECSAGRDCDEAEIIVASITFW